MKFKDYGVEIKIKGYEKNRYDDDDSWANVLWKIHNSYVHYENNSYDIESIEIEELRDMLKEFLDGTMQENEHFEPLETAFALYFYPKGKEYGRWLNPETQEPKIIPEIELYIYFVENNNYCITDSSFNYLMDKEDAEDLYNYLVEITK